MNRFLLAALLGTASLSAAEEFFEDDFSEEVEGRWERIAGEWVVENGAMVHVQDYSAGLIQSGSGGCYLDQHLTAVVTRRHHLPNAAHLPFDAGETVDQALVYVAVVHGLSFSTQYTPRGYSV